MTLSYAKIRYELHEVDLKNKPIELLKISPKATVPVLILENGRVLDESLAIMKWALKQSDPKGWLINETRGDELIRLNDNEFKPLLDNYKYPQKSEKKDPSYYRDKARNYLEQLNLLLKQQEFLLAEHIGFADIAIFPFIRQFYMVDKEWFVAREYKFLQAWLDYFLNSALFLDVMKNDE